MPNLACMYDKMILKGKSMSFKSEISKYKQNKTLIKNVDYTKISKNSGIYIVELINGKNIEIANTTTAITEYVKNGKMKNLVYSKSKLMNKLSLCDKEFLYVGKAEAKDGGLNTRISQLIGYAYGKCNNHRGGRALWQIKDWQNILNIYWCEVENAEKIEKHLLQLHSVEHPNKIKGLSYPFANWRL